MDGVGRVMTIIGTGQNTWPRLAQSDASFPGHDSEASDTKKQRRGTFLLVVARGMPGTNCDDSVS